MKTNKPEKSIVELLIADEKSRTENCSRKLDEVLKEFNCSIDISMIVRQDGVIPQLRVIANPAK
jgi:hypothetical protein